MLLQVPAILTNVSLTHDNGLRLSFATNEMSQVEKQGAIELHDKFGHLLFSPNPISERDIPKENAEDRTKTPSKRLRAVLYLLHVQQNGKPENFEAFYRARMEQLIDQIKARLDQ
jgi:hypothetical protein